MSDKVYTGHVRSWCSIKGYGFVWSDEFGDSVFIHASSFGGGDLTVGKTVNFRVKVDEKSADSKNICYDVHGEAVVKDGAGGRDRPSDTRASRREAPRYERADAKRLDSRERRDDRRDPRDDRRYDSRDRRPYDIRDDRRASDYDRRPYDSRDRRDYDRREYDRRDYDRREYDRRDFDRQPERRPSYDTRYHDRR